MQKETQRLLDDVLSYLGLDTTWGTLRQTFPDSSVPKERLRIVIRKLEKDGYINRYSGGILLTGEDGYLTSTRIVRNVEGEIFISEGGYTTLESRKKTKTVSNKIKIGVEIFVSFLAVGVSILSLVQGDKISKLENKNEQLQSQIDSLIKKINVVVPNLPKGDSIQKEVQDNILKQNK